MMMNAAMTSLTCVLDAELQSRHEHQPPNVAIDEETASRREQHGQCPRCGQQLFKLPCKSGGGFWRSKLGRSNSSSGEQQSTPSAVMTRKEPLSIEGKVQRGQCLVCSNVNASAGGGGDAANMQGNNHAAAAASSERFSLLQHDAFGSSGSNNDNNNHAATTTSFSMTPGSFIYEGAYDSMHRFHDSNATLTWKDSQHVYRGSFVHGQRHGQGTLTFGTGGEYVGDFVNNQLHGSGTRRYPNGDVYVGEFVRNQRHASHAKLYFSNGDLYVGCFVNDDMQTTCNDASSFTGTAKYYYASGQRFQGSFYNNQRHGRGKLQKVDGTLDVFVYKHDVRHGPHGLRWSKDRTKVWLVACATGKVRKKISVAEAVSLEYELQQEADRLWSQVMNGNGTAANGHMQSPEFGPADSVAGSSVRGLMT